MIDWDGVAKNNGLTPKEFQKDIFMAAAALGAKSIDETDGHKGNVLKFSSSDGSSDIVMFIKRVGQHTK